jgi:hypothetical protein
MSDNLLLDLTPSEVTIIRSALRAEQEQHKRNDFRALEVGVAELRNKISNAIMDSTDFSKVKVIL